MAKYKADDDARHYPVRRRGEKRRLTPNTDGAAWLEEESWFLTNIPGLDDELPDPDTGLIFYAAVGADQRNYSRPAFQLIVDGGFSGAKQRVEACPCYRFDLSWQAAGCTDHTELPWDDVRRRWVRPCTDLPSCGCTPCYIERQDRTDSRHRLRAEREAVQRREDAAEGLTLYDRLLAMEVSPAVDSTPRHNYFAFGHEVSLPEVAADPVLREEYRGQRVMGFPDFTVHLEVIGESADGTEIRVRLEGEWRDSSG